jgi:hypothetical protein
MFRLTLALAAVAASALAIAAGAFAGVSGPSIYVDGTLYRTVGTPTDFSNTGAPLSSFETIYALGGQDHNVAVAAPGDPGFRGGRWQVHAIAYNTSWAATVAAHDTNSSGDLDSAGEVEAALADMGPGGATDEGVVKLFECPVIPVPHGGH